MDIICFAVLHIAKLHFPERRQLGVFIGMARLRHARTVVFIGRPLYRNLYNAVVLPGAAMIWSAARC
jgi:hypothetical protein